MNDKKHIDRLFQEKLKDFEAVPDDSVWENIHHALHKEDKRNRKIIPIWWKVAGVAALLALLLTFGIKFVSDFSTRNNTVVDIEKQSSEDDSNSNFQTNPNDGSIHNEGSTPKDNLIDNTSKMTEQYVESDETQNDSNSINNFNSEESNKNVHNSDKSNTNRNQIVTNSKKDSNDKNDTGADNRGYRNSTQKNHAATTKDAVANVTKSDKQNSNQNPLEQNKAVSETDNLIKNSKNNTSSAVTNASDKMEEILEEEKKEELIKEQSIEDAIANANTEEETDEKEKKLNRWNISPNVAPVYFNSLGKGSSLDAQFVENTKNGEVTMSYGVGGSYALNDRLKVRAGINKVGMGYNTNNVLAFRSIDSTGSARVVMKNVSVSNNSQNLTFLSAEGLSSNNTPEIINVKSNSSISQRFGFIEVPLEVEYALVNKKVAVNVIGGFSTLIVDNNDIYSVIDGVETRIGEANNINNMSYSANFGLGINYNISEKIKVNVEPTFKYQINTFNSSSGDFQPFFIGLYTGLSYKF